MLAQGNVELIDVHVYHRFTDNDEFDTEKQLGQTIVEAPNDCEGKANVHNSTTPVVS